MPPTTKDALEDLFAPAPAPAPHVVSHTADAFDALLQSREQPPPPHALFAPSSMPTAYHPAAGNYAAAPPPSVMPSSAWTAAHDGGWSSGLPAGVSTAATHTFPYAPPPPPSSSSSSALPGMGGSSSHVGMGGAPGYAMESQAGGMNDFFGAAVRAPVQQQQQQQQPIASSAHDPWSMNPMASAPNQSGAHAMGYGSGNNAAAPGASMNSNTTQNMWATLSNFDNKQS